MPHKSDKFLNKYRVIKRYIQNLVKHLRRSVLWKQLTTKSR